MLVLVNNKLLSLVAHVVNCYMFDLNGYRYFITNMLYFPAAWREFIWGAIAGAFGEGMMHPIDTIKTRIQSQAILYGSQV